MNGKEFIKAVDLVEKEKALIEKLYLKLWKML